MQARVKQVAAALESNTSVVTLSLEGNDVGVDGAKILAAMLERNSTLEFRSIFAGIQPYLE